jgi:putative CocE/NonD family hydrolase
VFDALDRWQEVVRRNPADQPELLATPAGAIWSDWLARRDDAPWWDRISGRGAGAHDAAALVVGGWFDIFHHGSLALHAELASGRARAAQLIIGPWDHSPLPLASGSGDSEFGWRAVIDLPGLSLQWLDHTLRDGSAPLPSVARTFATGADTWFDWGAWPPPARQAVLRTAPSGRLVPESGDRGAADVDVIVADARDPAPAIGGRLYARPRHTRPGQMDQRPRADRGDVLTYVAEAATHDTLIAGPVRAEIWSSSTRSGPADIAATLVDQSPDGRALNVAEGVTRCRLTAGTPACFDIELGHVAHVLRPGHRLRLDLAAAAFPRVDVAPFNGTATRSIHHEDPASRLILPVV